MSNVSQIVERFGEDRYPERPPHMSAEFYEVWKRIKPGPDYVPNLQANNRRMAAQIARLTEQVRVAREAMQDADRRLNRPDWTVQRDSVRMKLRSALTLMEKNDD